MAHGNGPPEASSRMARTFVAIELPTSARQILARTTDALRRQWPADAVRWSRPEGTHLTLRFLGDTTASQVARLQIGLSRVAAGFEPLELALTEVGAFPNLRRPRVIWVGVREESGALRDLQRQVEEMSRRLGWEPEKQVFKPHLTLGRVKARKTPAREWGAPVKPLVFRAGAVALMESQLRPGGAEYSALCTAGLGSG